ncbi:2'-5' RNA ligase family protein [Roseateles sp. BYS78W]|uniref:2'-5' RNA ligase family protein n=1 Tax=Pelomonas candidula TaxID=3299025 RepID=UPI00374970C5
MGMPSAVQDAIEIVLKRYDVDKLLGRALFTRSNWHQSLSDRHWPEDVPDLRERLLRAGSRVQAFAVPMTLNRIVAQGEHWAFKARGTPQGFAELLAAVQRALKAEGIDDRVGHTPHVTISYTAPANLRPPKIRESIDWILDEILLVSGGGTPYHYEVVGRWPLIPIAASSQQSLF